MTAAKTYTLTKDSGASATTRTAIGKQSGTWLYISGGVWAGYWVRQSSVVFLAASPILSAGVADATFDPAATFTVKMGTHTGYQFSATGAMTAQKSYTLTKDSNAPTTARAAITNQSGTWLYVSGGVWAGYCVRASDVIVLAP